MTRRVLILFPDEWDRAAAADPRFRARHEFLFEGFDLFSFPDNVKLFTFDARAFAAKLVRKYRWTQRRDAEKTAQSQHLNRSVHWYFDENDTFVLNARLPPEIGALVAQALQAAEDVLREEVRDAVRCHFGKNGGPSVIRLHYVRDEVLAA